jgi:hypothetical protein
VKSENGDYGKILKAFRSEYQQKLVEFIVGEAEELNQGAKAALDRFFETYSGPIEGDPRDYFLALVSGYVEVAFTLGFTIGHSKQIPALRLLTKTFLEYLKVKRLIPKPETVSDAASAPVGNA